MRIDLDAALRAAQHECTNCHDYAWKTRGLCATCADNLKFMASVIAHCVAANLDEPLNELLTSPRATVRNLLATAQGIPPRIVEKLFGDRNLVVRRHACESSSATDAALLRAFRSHDPIVRMTAVERRKERIPRDMLIVLANDRY